MRAGVMMARLQMLCDGRLSMKVPASLHILS